MPFKFTVPITHTITEKQVEDVLGSGSGGLSYVRLGRYPDIASALADPAMSLTVWFDPDCEQRPAKLTHAKIKSGLRRMAIHHPDHFADLLANHMDAYTYECFVQACVLGEWRFS